VKHIQKWIIILIITLPMLIGAGMLLRTGPGKGGSPGYTLPAFRKIGLVEIKGPIYESDEYVGQIRDLRLDNAIAAVIVRINSPGGAVAPSQEIFAEMMKFRNSGKLLAVSMGTVAASGGYYIASPAQKIFADPGTLTGSIGVIFSLPMYAGLAKKIGVEMRVLKAGSLKDAGSPYRPLSPDEKKYFDDLLEDTHEQFISDVAKARKMNRDSIARLADGRIYTGRQALTVRLIDTLGGYENALDWLRTAAGILPTARVVRKKPASSRLREWFDEESARIFPFLQTVKQPAGLYYLMDLKQ
jgi:protease-4